MTTKQIKELIEIQKENNKLLMVALQDIRTLNQQWKKISQD